MPRVTYTNRLETLLNGPMSTNDKTFATSLLDFYTRKGRLTPGRARCVKQLEERYSPENIARAAGENAGMIARLGDLAARLQAASWAGEFVKSLTDQIKTGRSLSPRQVQILTKIESENSAEQLAASQAFASDYVANADGMRDKALIVARYYEHTGYFGNLVTNLDEDPAYVPSEKQYRKMVENKYAQKVLACHHAAPKYAVGSFVALRSGASWADRQATGNKPCVVIQTNAAPITSAARGAKKYKVLPIGSAKPVIVEERHLKIARKLK